MAGISRRWVKLCPFTPLWLNERERPRKKSFGGLGPPCSDGVRNLAAPQRGVFESPEATEALYKAMDKWARAEDAWEALKWVLAHDPEAADSIALDESGRTRTVTWHGARSANMPTINVLYEWDLNDVTILDARFADATAQQFGRA